MATRVHHRFDVAEYERMIAEGILTEEDDVELIRGEILAKMPIGSRHAACVKRLNRLLMGIVGDLAIVGVQDPIRLADSVPQPDVTLLRTRADFYEADLPGAADVLLVVEVADTSLEFDRETKGRLYAEAGIACYWLVNLEDGVLEVFAEPGAGGLYGRVEAIGPGGEVEVPGSGRTVAVAELFG
jgi:hypothetical protein